MNIVVIGNCQVRPLVTILSEMCRRDIQFDYIVAHLSNSESEQSDGSRLLEADLIITQPIDDNYKAKHLSTSRLRALHGEKVVAWPNVFYTGHCPDLLTATDQSGTVIRGPLETYQLSGVMSAWKNGLSAENAFHFLQNNLPHDDEILQTSMTTSLLALKQREVQTDITISDFLESELTTQRLFFTFNHPTANVLIELAERILDYCDIRIEKRVIAEFWEEPLGRLTYPMSAPMAEYLNLDFPTTDACRGVEVSITESKVTTGKSRLYSFIEFIDESYKAYDAQLNSDSNLRCTPQYLTSHLSDQLQQKAA